MSYFDKAAKIALRQSNYDFRTEFYSNTRDPRTREYNAQRWMKKLKYRSIITSMNITTQYL
jgi:hypothetical protein